RDLLVEQLLDDAKAVETRHLHVQEDESGRELLDEVHRLHAVLTLRHDVHIEIAQEIRQLVTGKLLVIHDDCRQGHASSSEKYKCSRACHPDRALQREWGDLRFAADWQPQIPRLRAKVLARDDNAES